MSTHATPRTALAPHVAADGNKQIAVTFEQMERMAATMAKSGLFGMKTPDQALALMLISQAEGRHPALAAQEYHIIQGRPSLKADTLLSRFQQAGGSVKWNSYTDQKVSAIFSHSSGGTVPIEWTMERAKAVKNWNKDKNCWEALTDKLNWQNYPRAMLRARVISEGVRTCYPGVAVGIYTPEEIEDGVPEVDVTPTSINAAVQQATEAERAAATALTQEEREEHMKAIKSAGNQELLARAFGSAWTHASEAKDKSARDAFKTAYDGKKEELSKLAEVVK